MLDIYSKLAYTYPMMTKKQAISIFGNVKTLADSIGTTTQNFYMFADPLTLANSDRIIGAAVRNGFDVPDDLKTKQVA